MPLSNPPVDGERILERGFDGFVTFMCTVRIDGSLDGCAKVTGGTTPAEDELLVGMLAQWRFEPARRNGCPVSAPLRGQHQDRTTEEPVLALSFAIPANASSVW